MVETRTIEEDAGKHCDTCGKDIYRLTQTYWLATHGEYCSQNCAKVGERELDQAIGKVEAQWARGAANDDRQ